MFQVFQVTAGGRLINAAATFFRYEAAAAEQVQTIRVRADGQDLGTFEVGDAVELPMQAARWEVVPVSATLTGTVRLGVGRVSSARLAGVVSVVDTAKLTTERGQAFEAGGGFAAPAAGQFGTWQLVNPVASGRRVIVETLTVAAPGIAAGFLCGITSVQQGPNGSVPRSKLSGGAVSVCNMATRVDHATDPGTLVPSPAFFGVPLAAGANFRKQPVRPYVLNPGFQLTVACRTAAAPLDVSVEFYEELL